MGMIKLDGTFDWTGVPWLWSSSFVEPNTYAWFTRSFEINTMPDSAPFAISANKSYKLYVNGDFILMGPMREEKPYFYFDALDISPLLHVGQNNIAILAHSQSGSGEKGIQSSSGLTFQGELVWKDKTLDLTNHTSWICRRSRRYSPESHKLGSALGVGYSELFDFSEDESGWHLGNFTGSRPAVAGCPPGLTLSIPLERDMPFFSGNTFEALSVTRKSDGLLADFGQEVFGFVHLSFKSQKRSRFSISYSELLTDGEVDFRKAGMDYRDQIIAPAGEFSWNSYEKRAMRYLFIDDPELEIYSIKIHEYGYPYIRKPIAKFEVEQASVLFASRPEACATSGDLSAVRAKILDVSARTIELCSDDLLNDCPWRERAQYLDPYAYFGSMQKLFGTLEPAKKFLRQFARGAGNSVPMPMCYPSPSNMTVIPDFVLTYAVALRKYLDLSGDIETVRECFKVSEETVEYYRKFEDNDGLLSDVPGWIFLDNSFELCRNGKSCGLNATYAGALSALADIADLLGHKDKSICFKNHFNSLRNSFRKVFLQENSLLDSGSCPSFTGKNHWNYHFPGDTGSRDGKSFMLRTKIIFPTAGSEDLSISFFNGCRVWLDGRAICEFRKGGGWDKSPFYNPQLLQLPDISGRHEFVLEVEHSEVDWEIFLSTHGDPGFEDTYAVKLDEFGKCLPDDPHLSWTKTHIRPYYPPKLSQVSVALASLFGMLENDEAARLLKSVLPEKHYSNYRKRTTPYFVEITEDRKKLETNILPCNTPWSMNFLCQALRKHGMEEEAEKLVLKVYGKQIELGATSWWEEWGTGSSLCHAWGSFAAEYIS
ncbi:MAG TPA: hypothetical protein DET40_19875 [Lentisphaeria bacterium]|nr:MAG: hypothetical protein A2X45_00865 [Lentisphaerae bacterium GWF2_50_93]HCE45809.1 hypothetical protein [Lentisphaeria bacterium]